jgi:hypothetical protein
METDMADAATTEARKKKMAANRAVMAERWAKAEADHANGLLQALDTAVPVSKQPITE